MRREESRLYKVCTSEAGVRREESRLYKVCTSEAGGDGRNPVSTGVHLGVYTPRRKRSASMAALHPLAAAVMACR